MPFDIASFRAFAPAEYQCEKCRALLKGWLFHLDGGGGVCPVCHVKYLPTEEFPDYKAKGYLNRDEPTCLDAQEALAQAHQLAEIAERMGFYQLPTAQRNGWTAHRAYTPLRGLLKALSIAQTFVHFTTYGGIPHLLIGALKVTAQRVPIRGIVSGSRGEVLSEGTVSELTNYGDEAPEMHVKIYDSSLTGWATMPHQKLIIIDGLLAFKGSANLTLAGWRKAAEGRDVVEVVTEVEQVIELNNRLFAPIWAELSDLGETITMARPGYVPR
jgi:phosphatidylserine/phosphatidylglycerophosphate/cardiolipin synthase-like enzyme